MSLETFETARDDSTSSRAYQSVVTAIGIAERKVGIIEVQGKDALDFLHRMSTNDVKSLQQAKTCITILTTEKGRVVDIITILHKNDMLLLLTSGAGSNRVLEWLEKYVIMEDIQFRDITENMLMYSLVGPKTEDLLKEYLQSDGVVVHGSELIEISGNGTNSIIFQDELWPQPVYNMLLRKNEAGEFLLSASKFAKEKVIALQSISEELWNILRIENGVPLNGFEISDQVNPLEAHLEKFVSFSKGCYIGQEVIARTDTYQKLQKKLTGFIFDIPQGTSIQPGKIYYEGVEAGWTTSHSWSYALNKSIALGYLKSNINAIQVEFQSSLSEGQIKAVLSKLPFERYQ